MIPFVTLFYTVWIRTFRSIYNIWFVQILNGYMVGLLTSVLWFCGFRHCPTHSSFAGRGMEGLWSVYLGSTIGDRKSSEIGAAYV